MTSIVPIAIKLLKAAAPVTALVSDRIEPEVAPEKTGLPCIVVRSGTSRQVYGLALSTGMSEARFTVLCAAETFTAADRIAEVVKAVLRDVQHVPVADRRVTLLQDGADSGSWDEQGRTFNRVVEFRASVSG